jgi:hypothetical protein
MFSLRWIWRMPSTELLRRVALVKTDVSEERSASIIRVTIIDDLGTTLAVTRLLNTVQTCSVVHPTFSPISTGGTLLGARGCKSVGVLLTTQPNYVPKSKSVDLYIHVPNTSLTNTLGTGHSLLFRHSLVESFDMNSAWWSAWRRTRRFLCEHANGPSCSAEGGNFLTCWLSICTINSFTV